MAKKVIRHRSPINSTINKELHAELRTLSKESGIPISKLLDKAIKLLLEEYRGKDYIKIDVDE